LCAKEGHHHQQEDYDMIIMMMRSQRVSKPQKASNI